MVSKKDFVSKFSKFSKPNSLIVYRSLGIFDSAKDFMILLRTRRSV